MLLLICFVFLNNLIKANKTDEASMQNILNYNKSLDCIDHLRQDITVYTKNTNIDGDHCLNRS